MDNAEFERFLNSVAEWRKDCDPRRDDPETQAWPRVTQIKRQPRPCEYCDNTCARPKKIKYSDRLQSWVVKCQDCGDKHFLPVSLARKYK